MCRTDAVVGRLDRPQFVDAHAHAHETLDHECVNRGAAGQQQQNTHEQEMSELHIDWTRYASTFCMLNRCPTCDRDRRMLGQFQEWYGTTWTCTGCGDRWNDGEMEPRPFCPGWRKERIENARRKLAEIGLQA